MKILLIDDSSMMLKFMTGLLADQGHEIVGCTDFQQALAKFADPNQRFEGILCDFVLEQGKTGIEMIETLYSIWQKAPASPVYKKPIAALLTQGELSEKDQQRAEHLKVHCFKKPKMGSEEDFVLNIGLWTKSSS